MKSKEFQIARFNLLTVALDPAKRDLLPDSYVFAWYQSLYPVFSDNPLHGVFSEDFAVTKVMMNDLTAKLQSAWDGGRSISFYEIEDDVDGGDWDRPGLVSAVRYVYLASVEERRFDQKLFESLIADSGAPMEANSFMRPFERSEEIHLT